MTTTWKVFGFAPVPVVGMKPEKNDGVRSPTSQGEPKGPWVTVWFLAKNVNSRTSFTSAVVMFGLKAKLPPLPTSIEMVLATVVEARTAAAMVKLLNNMLRDVYWVV